MFLYSVCVTRPWTLEIEKRAGVSVGNSECALKNLVESRAVLLVVFSDGKAMRVVGVDKSHLVQSYGSSQGPWLRDETDIRILS